MSKKDELIKSFYSLFSSYDKNSIGAHSKKGSEIKDGLSSVSILLNNKKAECLDMMTAELAKINFKPDSPSTNYSEYHHLLDCIPKTFSYDLISEGERYVSTERGIEEEATKMPTTEERSEMREYNRYAHKYMEYCVNKLKIDTLRKNIQDNKSYNLTIEQLAILGL